MTGLSRTDGSTGFERLAALSRRSRPARTGRGDGPSFDMLLADALTRQAQPNPAQASGQPAAWTRPQGALGVGSLAIDTLTNSASAATSTTSETETATTATAAADKKASVDATVTSGSAGEAVVNAAAKHLGVPYLWGGTDAEHGFDCSGLIQDAYRQIGVEMPKWSRHQATMGVEVPSLDEALPGDVIAFGDPVNHVGLYVGDGKMLHAPKTGDVVRVGPIERPIVTIRRIVEPTAGQSKGAATMAELLATAESGAAPSIRKTAEAARTQGSSSNHVPGDAEARYQPLFEAAGERWDVDPALLAAVAKTESAFNPNAVSHVGAQGLMQFMPATAREMGVNPLDPASAIDGAARYLRTSLDQFENTEHAIASYNAGRGAVSRYGGIPPYRETQNYVVKVLEAWRSRS